VQPASLSKGKKKLTKDEEKGLRRASRKGGPKKGEIIHLQAGNRCVGREVSRVEPR